jgi:hypothetical protein
MMTANSKNDLAVIVNLRRTTNFQAEVIRRYAKLLSEIDAMVTSEKIAGTDDPLLEKIDGMVWAVRLDITKMIEES